MSLVFILYSLDEPVLDKEHKEQYYIQYVRNYANHSVDDGDCLCNTHTVASIVEQGEANEPRSGRGKPWAAKQQAARLIWQRGY